MPETATLDVLIPHHEDIVGLEVSLRSVAEQTWTGSLRVVLVDDGSSPSTFRQVENLTARQPFEVQVVRTDHNVGRPRARNLLLRQVRAEHMAWLDAGDAWYPDKLAIQFEHLRRLADDGVDVDRVWVTCHYDWAEGDDLRSVLQRTSQDQLADLLIGDHLRAYLWTLLTRTTAFRSAGLFDERLARMQDLDYFLRFVRTGGSLSVPPDSGALCRYDKTDLGRSHSEVSACAELIMRKHRAAFANYGRGFVARARWKNAALAARYALNNDSPRAAVGYIATAMAANPRYTAYRLRRRLLTR